MSTIVSRASVLGLYKYMLRVVQKLPQEARPYYYEHLKSHWFQYRFETDPERVKIMFDRGKSDSLYILRKYTKKDAE